MFGELLRKERRIRKKTLRELSKDLGISFSALGKYERGENEPDIATLINISKYFDVSVDYMLGISDIKNINGITMLSHDHHLSEKIRELDPDEQKIVLQIINSINLLLEPYFNMGEKFDKDILKLYSDIFRKVWGFNSFVYDEYICNKKVKKISDSELKDAISLRYFYHKTAIDCCFQNLLDIYISRSTDIQSRTK